MSRGFRVKEGSSDKERDGEKDENPGVLWQNMEKSEDGLMNWVCGVSWLCGCEL